MRRRLGLIAHGAACRDCRGSWGRWALDAVGLEDFEPDKARNVVKALAPLPAYLRRRVCCWAFGHEPTPNGICTRCWRVATGDSLTAAERHARVQELLRAPVVGSVVGEGPRPGVYVVELTKRPPAHDNCRSNLAEIHGWSVLGFTARRGRGL